MRSLPWFSFGLLLQVISARGDMQSRCDTWQFLDPKSDACKECPECPAGQMNTRHCGYDFSDKKLTQPRPHCESCPPEEYKSEKSVYECNECSPKCGKHRVEIIPCNFTHDRVCSSCPQGYYSEQVNGDCYPCQPCCAGVEGEEFKIQKCVQDGMGHCSCRPATGCIKSVCKSNLIRMNQITSHPTTSSSTSQGRKTQSSAQSTINPTPDQGDLSDSKRQKEMKSSTELLSTRTTINSRPDFLDSKSQEDKQRFTKQSPGSVIVGWPIAVIICFLFVFAIIFSAFIHSKQMKKIKKRLDKKTISSYEPREDEEKTKQEKVVFASGQYQEAPRQNRLNFAELVDSPSGPLFVKDSSSDEECPVFSCHGEENPTVFLSHYESHEGISFKEPSAHSNSDSNPMHTEIWPYSRAEINNETAVDYEGYIHINTAGELTSATPAPSTTATNTTTTNTTGTNTATTNTTSQNPSEIGEKLRASAMLSCEADDKEGEENSEAEEVRASTLTFPGENIAVAIATERHRQETSRGSGGKKEKAAFKRKHKKTRIKSSSVDIPKCSCAHCIYRPYTRETPRLNCKICVPQPDDDFYKIIERQCLRAEICTELNKKNVPNWNELSIYIRIDKQIPRIKESDNPADIVLERLKTARPRMTLEDFYVILRNIQRHDVMHAIMCHHVTCLLCKRNSFDGSLQDLHIDSNIGQNCSFV